MESNRAVDPAKGDVFWSFQVMRGAGMDSGLVLEVAERMTLVPEVSGKKLVCRMGDEAVVVTVIIN
jgi:hypothetical protein